MNKRVNFRQWWDEVGTENAMKVADRVTTRGYFKAFKYGMKKPGADMALAIIEAAREITPACVPDLELLIRGVPKAGTGGVLVPSPPSPGFVKAMQGLTSRQAQP
jgi:hypothetical protein